MKLFLTILLLTITVQAQFTEVVKWDLCTPLMESGFCECRKSTTVFKNGVKFGNSEFFRKAFAPGDDVSELPAQLQAGCKGVATAEKIQAYKDKFKNLLPR